MKGGVANTLMRLSQRWEVTWSPCQNFNAPLKWSSTPPLVFLIMCVCVCAHVCAPEENSGLKRGLCSFPFTIRFPATELRVAHRQLLISGFGKKGKMKELMSETRPHCLQQLCGLYETRHLAGSLCMYNNLIILISCPGTTAWYWKDKDWRFLFICSYLKNDALLWPFSLPAS